MIVEVIPRRMMRDRSSIVAFFHEASGSSDGDPGKSDGFDRTITFGLMHDRGPCDEDHRVVCVMEIGCTGKLCASPRWAIDQASFQPSDDDWEPFRDAVCHKVSPLINFTYAIIPARASLMIARTRVHAISAIRSHPTLAFVHVTCNREEMCGT